MESEFSRLVDALPGLVWTTGPDGVADFVNKAWRDYTGLTVEAVRAAEWTSSIHPEDLATAVEAWNLVVKGEASSEIEARFRRFDGVYRRFNIQARPLRDATGAITGWCGINTDIEDQKRAEALLAAEKHLLELVARGVALPSVLDQLCLQVEQLTPGSVCSILFVDPDGHRFRVGAGPNVPADYNALLDGLKIDPSYGPCSLAVESRSTIIASDPPRDPRWSSSPWPELVVGFGLASCWSAPIFGSRGEVLGIFAIYKRQPVGPRPEEEELVDRFAKHAGIAIERAQSDALLAASTAELQRANQFLAGAQRLSKTGSFTLEPASDEQVWSEENYRIWEVDPAVRPNMAIAAAAMHPDDRAETLRIFAEAAQAEEDFEVFYRIVTPVGGVKHLHTVMKVIREITDRIVYLGSTQDVTESRRAEAALRESEANLMRVNTHLSAAQRLTQTGSYSWDAQTLDLDWSEESYRIWDFDPAVPPTMEMIVAAFHPDDRDKVMAAIEEAARTRGDFDEYYRIVTRDGAVKHLHTVSTPNPAITDHCVFLGSTQDVTESTLAEEALRASQENLVRANTYLTAAQRLSQTGSFTWDVERDEHNWSEVIYRVFGFEPGIKVTMEMINKAIHPEDVPQVQALLGNVVAGETFELVFRILWPDGAVRHAHVMGHRIAQIPDRPVFMGALQDITARKIAENDLNRARAELAHVARVTALSTLTASIAHEVNQPLAGIITNASTCLRMLAADPPNIEGARATAQRTIRDGNRASEVIKRLRALFARTPPSMERVDLNDAAREVLALSSSELQRRRVVVRTQFAADLPPVLGDRVQLQQVMLNLILNAADAMDGIEDRPRDLNLQTAPGADGSAVFRVRDVGIGLDPANVGQLFDPFHTTKPDGMGIGLSISRSIIDAHGGRLDAAPNDVGPGAVFSFCVPCEPPQAAGLELRKA